MGAFWTGNTMPIGDLFAFIMASSERGTVLAIIGQQWVGSAIMAAGTVARWHGALLVMFTSGCIQLASQTMVIRWQSYGQWQISPQLCVVSVWPVVQGRKVKGSKWHLRTQRKEARMQCSEVIYKFDKTRHRQLTWCDTLAVTARNTLRTVNPDRVKL